VSSGSMPMGRNVGGVALSGVDVGWCMFFGGCLVRELGVLGYSSVSGRFCTVLCFFNSHVCGD